MVQIPVGERVCGESDLCRVWSGGGVVGTEKASVTESFAVGWVHRTGPVLGTRVWREEEVGGAGWVSTSKIPRPS